MWAVQGILAALYERQRTGKGRLVEFSLLETAIGFSSWTSAQWLADPQVRHRGLVQYASAGLRQGRSACWSELWPDRITVSSSQRAPPLHRVRSARAC